MAQPVHEGNTSPSQPLELTPCFDLYGYVAKRSQPLTKPRLWMLDLTSESVAPGSMRFLDDREREKADGFRSPVDRTRFIASHSALRRILGTQLGQEPEDVRLARADCPVCGAGHGRPVVEDSSLHFSLSRRAGYCLIALARTPVGADLEVRPATRVVDELAHSLHPRERALLELCPPAQRGTVFTRVWTRKEAYLKGLGIGLAMGVAGDSVAEDAPVPGWKLYDVTAPVGLAAALAVKDPNSTGSLMQ